jgi:hypothetical protein
MNWININIMRMNFLFQQRNETINNSNAKITVTGREAV